jgi:uncharacterized protein (DUF302 family)
MKAEMETDQEQMIAEMKAGYEEMMARLEDKMGSHHEELMTIIKEAKKARNRGKPKVRLV